MQKLGHRVFSIGAASSLLTLLAGISGCSSGGDSPDISGELEVPGFLLTDSDVNDVLATNRSNNTPSSAQAAPNPATIGGYVNTAFSGNNGQTFRSGDISDFYRVDLKAEQTLVLDISDSDTADLDLELYDQSILTNPTAAPILVSEDVTKFESIKVLQDGTYFVRVYPFQGASNYLLSIGLTPASDLSGSSFKADAEFVPGELIVGFDTTKTTQSSSFSAMGLDAVNKGDEGIRLYRMKNEAMVSAKGVVFSQLSESEKKVQTLRKAKKLRTQYGVKYVEPNYIRHASAVPNDTYYSYQWHYPLMNLPAAWDITTGDSSAVVAVIDTGVLLGHADLQGQLVSGYDFISNSSVSGDGNGIDSNPDDPGDGGIFSNSSFHGTHVAGTIAAASNNNEGVAGVAWGAKIMPLRVLGSGGGNDYDIAQAIRYAAGLANDSGTVPDDSADVINLSLGGTQSSQSLNDAVQAARSAGVIIIAAAGNESTSSPSYPASYQGVVSVSAVTLNRTLADYSNFGSTIDVAAPGGDTNADLNGDGRGDGVLSTAGDDSNGFIRYGYVAHQGTSMAAPHIAGVVALMKSVHPNLTPAEFDTALQSGAITSDIGSAGKDTLYGHGLIDAYDAVVEAERLRGGVGTVVETEVSLSPQSLSFGLTSSSATIYVDKVGTDVLGINTVFASEDWLSVSESQVDGLGFGSYQVVANRQLLIPGTYTGTVTIQASNGSSKSVNVILQSLDQAFVGDAGTEYVFLIDAARSQPVGQVKVEAVSGSSSYSFGNVGEGSYYVLAGSDMDNDGVICDAGEACGIYPTEDQPVVINWISRITGINFLTTYAYESPSAQSFGVPKTTRRQYRIEGK